MFSIFTLSNTPNTNSTRARDATNLNRTSNKKTPTETTSINPNSRGRAGVGGEEDDIQSPVCSFRTLLIITTIQGTTVHCATIYEIRLPGKLLCPTNEHPAKVYTWKLLPFRCRKYTHFQCVKACMLKTVYFLWKFKSYSLFVSIVRQLTLENVELKGGDLDSLKHSKNFKPFQEKNARNSSLFSKTRHSRNKHFLAT